MTPDFCVGVCLFVLNKPKTKNAISIHFVDKVDNYIIIVL